MESPRALLVQGEYDATFESLPDSPGGALLDQLEKGRVAMLEGDQALSFEHLQHADVLATELADQAVVRISEGFNLAASAISNDNALTYMPADYELGFLHLYRAYSYLNKGEFNGALVEIRRARDVQEQAKKARETELQQAAETAKENGVRDNVGAVLAKYPAADLSLAAIQNAYLFYFSGLLYEVEGNLNSAYIDYTRALAVRPENHHIAQAVYRVATKQGRQQDIKRLNDQYGDLERAGNKQGQLVILYEQGVVKPRRDWRLPLWFYDREGNQAFHNIAMPYYDNQPTTPLSALVVNGKNVQPLPLTDVNQMAQKSLSEAIPGMAVRQVIRLVAKNEIRRSLEKEGEEVGNFLANVMNTVTEQPDTRSWQSLPENVGLYSDYMAEGKHQVAVNGTTIDLDIKAGRTTLLWVSRQGNGLANWHKRLGEI